MTDELRAQLASEQLDRVLEFFPRVESKATFLFAFDTALLTIGILNFHIDDVGIWYVVVPAMVALICIGASLFYIYHSLFPKLDGGTESLIYFKEIAERTENKFISSCHDVDTDCYIKDLLGQVWRNSSILSNKFTSLRNAFALSIIATVPWFLYLVGLVFVYGRIPQLN